MCNAALVSGISSVFMIATVTTEILGSAHRSTVLGTQDNHPVKYSTEFMLAAAFWQTFVADNLTMSHSNAHEKLALQHLKTTAEQAIVISSTMVLPVAFWKRLLCNVYDSQTVV